MYINQFFARITKTLPEEKLHLYNINIKTSSNYHNIINIHSCRKIDAQNMQEKIMKENQ